MTDSVEVKCIDNNHVEVKVNNVVLTLTEEVLAKLLFQLNVASIEMKEICYAQKI